METCTTLAERIRICAEQAGSGDELSRKTAIPRRTLESYMTGQSEPKASRLAAIADVAAVSLDWLLYGREPTDENHQSTTAHSEATEVSATGVPPRSWSIEAELMRAIVDTIINIHKESEITVQPQDIARLASEKYVFLLEMSGVMIQQIDRMFGRDELVIYLDGLVNIIAAQLRESLKEAARPPVKRSA